MIFFINKIKNFWSGDGGGKRILSVALPLILSSASFSIMQFIDRRFLATYSIDSFRAAAPSGMLSFTFISVFFGTAAYVNTFISQYYGAKINNQIASSLWQGLYFAFFSWLVLLPLVFFAEPIFQLIKHHPNIIALEVQYFRVLIIGSVFVLMNLVLSSFYTGRGKTKVVMWVNFYIMFVNVALNYCFIFGNFGFPEMGIKGAAIGTVIANSFATVTYFFLILSKKNRTAFYTLEKWRFEKKLFFRLLRFGFPNGVQFLLNIFGFTFFLLMVGRIGDIELSATNAAWSLNILIFLPMVGISISVMTIVGQEIGRGRINVAKRATVNSFFITLMYMSVIALCFIFMPRFCLGVLLSDPSSEQIKATIDMATILLRFVAIYSLFDGVNLVFASAIKGAGDTHFVMKVSFACSMLIMVIPSYIGSTYLSLPVTVFWSFPTLFIITISIIIFRRYRAGKWESLKVIEDYGH